MMSCYGLLSCLPPFKHTAAIVVQRRLYALLSFCRSVVLLWFVATGCRLASGLLASPPRFGIRYASPLCFIKCHTFQTLLSKFRGAKTLLPPRSKLHRTRG